MNLWLWIEKHWMKIFGYGSLVICLLLLVSVLAGFGHSPRWSNFR